jgi:hypothetical protein
MEGRNFDNWGNEWKWMPLLPANGLEGLKYDGAWSREFDAVEANAVGGNASLVIYHGSVLNFELAVKVTVFKGGNAQIVRGAEGGGYYLVDFLMGWKALAVSRGGREGVRKLSVVNYDLRLNSEYNLELAARDASITTYLNGCLVNQVTDFELDRGPISFNVWEAHNRFREPKIRVLD